MSLLERLKNERDACVERYKRLERNLEVCKRELEMCDAEWGEFNVAIVALDPPRPSDFEAEKAVAREQLEREPIEPPTIEEVLSLVPDEPFYLDDEQDDTPAEHISDLTGDPAIEPEAGLKSGYDLYAEHLVAVAALDETPALNPDMQDDREQPVTTPACVNGEPFDEDGDCEEGLRRSGEYSEGYNAGYYGHTSDPEQSESWRQGHVEGLKRAQMHAQAEGMPVNSEARMFANGIQSEQKPEPDFNPWRGLFSGKSKVDA